MPQFNSSIEPVLGTRVAFRFEADDEVSARTAERLALDEFERLEAMFSAYRVNSAWNRWRRNELDAESLPLEIVEVLEFAERWHTISGGAFNPSIGVIRERWRNAIEQQDLPSRSEMSDLAGTIERLPYRVTNRRVERLGDCSLLDLHAVAKGWIVDRAAALAQEAAGIASTVVNAGGDLVRLGPGGIVIDVEDPRDPFDNAAPLVRAHLRQGGFATSSPSRRPLRIGDLTLHHVVDPRTGWPVEHVRSASVCAPDAATADAIATVVGVLPVEEGLAAVAGFTGVGCCLLDADGVMWRSGAWLDA